MCPKRSKRVRTPPKTSEKRLQCPMLLRSFVPLCLQVKNGAEPTADLKGFPYLEAIKEDKVKKDVKKKDVAQVPPRSPNSRLQECFRHFWVF